MTLRKILCLRNNYNVQSCRLISVGSSSSQPFRGNLPDPKFKTKEARTQNRRLAREKYKEVLDAQELRRPWEFPVQPDQRVSWKHRKWMDPYIKKWVPNIPPKIKDPVLGLHYREQRKPLANCENVKELFTLMLDSHKGKKFVVPAFDQDFPQMNLSYYYQFLTHSKYVHGLPHRLQHMEVDEEKFQHFVDFVKKLLMVQHSLDNSAEIENVYEKKRKSDSEIMKAIVNYLTSTQLDDNVQLNHNTETSMFWIRGRGFVKKFLPENISRAYQTHDRQLLQVSSKDRLSCFSKINSDMSNSGEIPYFATCPFLYGHDYTKYANMISTGQRLVAGDLEINYQEAYEDDELANLSPPKYNHNYFGHTQVCLLPSTYSRQWYEENLEHGDITSEIEEHLKAYGMMSGWAWTAAQASFAGHYMDKDVTEPWCSQVIVFDGKFLSFFAYQLNTLAIDEDNVYDHDRRNLCFGKTSVPLYEEINNEDVVGLNTDALKTIFNMISKQTSANTYSEEEITAYENNLLIQEHNWENPQLEDQKPLHVRQKEEEETRLALLEEERVKEEWNSKSLPAKVKHYVPEVPKLKALIGRK